MRPDAELRFPTRRAALRWGVGLGLALLGSSGLAAPTPTLRVGVSAYRPPALVAAEFQPVADALGEALGQPIRLRVLAPRVLAEAYADGQIDLMLGGATLHRVLQRRLPLPAPIATLRRSHRGQALTQLAAVLLVRTDAQVPADLRRLADWRLAVAEALAPDGAEDLRRELSRRGLPPVPPAQVVWTAEHDQSLSLLLTGQVDLALVRTGLLESLRADHPPDAARIRVLVDQRTPGFPLAHSTAPDPEWMALPGVALTLEQRRTLAVALMSLRLPAGDGVQPIVGFDPPADYAAPTWLDASPEPAPRDDAWRLVAALLLAVGLLGLPQLVRQRRHRRARHAADADAQRLRALHDALPIGVWHRDRAGHIRDINARVLRTMRGDDRTLPQPVDYAGLFPEAIAAQLADADTDTLGSGRVRHRRLRLATPDGHLREIELVQVRTLDARGWPDGVASVALERSAEATLDSTTLLTEYEQLLGRLSGELVAADARSVDAAIQRALAALGASCAVDRAYLFQLTRDGSHADNTHEWCATGVDRQIDRLQDLPMAQQLPWLLAGLQRRETLAIGDVGALPLAAAAEAAHLAEQGIRAALVVPLVAGERVVGFLGLDDTRGPRRWQPAEQALVRVVGEMLVHALLRLRAEQRHGETAAYLQALLGALPDLLFVVDPEGHYLDIHTRDQRKLARPGSDLIGKRIRETVPPEVAELAETALARIFGGSTLERFDYTLQIGDRDLTFSAEMVPLDPGRVLTICRDVTERRHTERALAASEARYRALVDHSQSLIFQLDAQQRLGFLSRSAQLLLGERPARLLGQPLLDLVAPEDHPALRRYLARLQPQTAVDPSDPGLDQGIELRVRQPDGRLRWLHVVMTPLSGPEGDGGLVGNAVDISGRVEARHQLIHLAAQRQALIDGIPSYLFAKDADGRYLLINRAGAASFGCTPEEVIGRTDADLLPEQPERAAAFRDADRRAAASDAPVLIDREPVRNPDGSTGWFQTIKTRWYPADDPRPGVLGVATNIDARVAVETQLRQESALTALLVRLALTYIDLPAARLADTIRQSVQELAGFVGADRGYLYRYDHATRHVTPHVAWCADGIDTRHPPQGPIDALAELTRRHAHGEVVVVADVAQLQDPLIQAPLAALGIRSLLSVPLMRGERCIGSIGFDWVRTPHTCSTGEIQLLTVFAQMLVNAQRHADASDDRA